MDKINEQMYQANIELVDKNKLLEEDKKILQKRINRAIEYMEEATNSDSFTVLPSGKTTDIEYCIVAFKDLLKILKGRYVDNE